MGRIDQLKALTLEVLIAELSRDGEVDPRFVSQAVKFLKDFASELEDADKEGDEAKKVETLQRYLERRRNLKTVEGGA